jgi:hypothetical protein
MKYIQTLSTTTLVLCAASLSFAQDTIPLPAELVKPVPTLAQDPSVHDPSFVSYETVTAASWTERKEESSRVVFSIFDLSDGWSEPLTVSESENSFDSDLQFSESGNLGVTWVEENEGSVTLQYHDLEGKVETITSSKVAIETPTVSFIDERPVVAWTEGGAGVFAVIVAERIEGEWELTPLSDSLSSYDILPTIIESDPHQLFWYHLTQDGFVLRHTSYDEGGWIENTNNELSQLPPDRLPYLFPFANETLPGAIWVEPKLSGDRILYFDPSSENVAEMDAVSNDETLVNQLDPEANGSDELALAWVEKSGSGNQLIISLSENDFLIPTITAPSQPRLAWSGERLLQGLSVSDPASGGDGQLYHIILPLNSE